MHPTRIVDSHLHLQDYEPGTNIADLLQKASDEGVSHLVCNGTSEQSWPIILGFAELYPQVVPCFGVHPWFIDECSTDWQQNLESFVEKYPSGVGEIGLDRLREPYDRKAQEYAFRAQLGISRRHGRPAMVHCVKAWGWMLDILRSEPALPAGFLLHSYGGSPDLVKPLAEMGAYFSFSGKVLFDNYGRARKSIKEVPMDRLLVETDAPCMLPPEPYRIHRIPTSGDEEYNHPANLPFIVEGIAELLAVPTESLQEILWQNSQRFFGAISALEVIR